jgi:hypothetical protein
MTRLVIPIATLLCVALGVTASGCARTDLRLDAMGVAAHRAAAAEARKAAATHRQQFDPYARTTAGTPTASEPGLPMMDDGFGDNPTAWRVAQAEVLEAHARGHEAAAAALERFEAAACAEVPARERGACPMLPAHASVQQIDGGVRIRLDVAADLAKIAARMRCHLAYARALGFDRAPACPLYAAGVDVLVDASARSIDVVVDRHAAVSELRRAVERLGR